VSWPRGTPKKLQIMKIEGTPPRKQGYKDTGFELELERHNRANYARKLMARRVYRWGFVFEGPAIQEGWPDTPVSGAGRGNIEKKNEEEIHIYTQG